ncbi:glycosyltransferase [Clostridium saudiense]|uniref:glycosyltransferase n=1 Tax=Clostridium saudiense TaxID=1414720 RepID=UPI000820B11E|nr:glycosyltransferase [Clostridium saudiense]MDU7455582.1 glycosyltransferase [Clostridium saudiense]SCJ99637.1 Hyaluronan synthase [uncultured Clostridium sp.]
MVKLSIIVPVYKVESYIEKCINSILKQTINNFEIILVDDGSPDKSGEICDRYAKMDSRIRVIHKENGGLSSARNEGLKYCIGEYVTFVDSDDYLCYDKAYEEMYDLSKKEGSDIVSGNCIWYYSDNNNCPMDRNMEVFKRSPMIGEEFFLASLKSDRTYAPVWLNIYRRSLLTENNIIFKEGIHHEDEEFTPRIILKANLISIYNKEFYVYVQRENSITNTKLNKKNGLDMINICYDLNSIISEIKNRKLKIYFKEYLAFMSIKSIYKYKIIGVKKEIKKMIFKNSKSFKLKIKSLIIILNENYYFEIEELINRFKYK